MTEPMTPAECDLRDYVWMPMDCNRLLTSETWLLGTAEQKVAALTLWMKSWHQVPSGSLPNNDRMLASLSEAGGRWAKVKKHALRGWVLCSDGRLYHPVVSEKARESWQHKLDQKARTEAARAAKAARKAALSGGSTEPVTEPVTTSVTEPVTGSTRPDQTRPDLKKEREEISFPFPRDADAGRAAPSESAEPSWPPKPHPSAVHAAVGVLAAKLEGRHRDTRIAGPHKPARDVDEQLAMLVPKAPRSRPAPPEVLAEARAKLMATSDARANVANGSDALMTREMIT